MNFFLSLIFVLASASQVHAGLFDDAIKSGIGAAVQSVVDKAAPQQEQGEKGAWTDDDVASFVKTFKTNLSQDELKTLFNSKLYLISLPSEGSEGGEFIYTLFLFGSSKLSLEQKKKFLGLDAIVDTGKEWYTRVVNLEKIGNDTVRLEFDLMLRADPTEPPKPAKRELFYRWNPSAGTLYIVQMRAYGTARGDIKINNDISSGFAAEQACMLVMEGIAEFLQTGVVQ